MSTSLDIPSSSGIVIVDNTSNNENILTTVQVQSHEHLPIHHIQQQSQQSAVVGTNEICGISTTDEYVNINTGGIDAQSGVINFTSNEVLNNTQIFKFVSEDNTTILEPSSEEIQSYCTSGRLNPGSKVHVISNIPFNPNKQHGQQAINLVSNGKNISANVNFVNAYITKNTGKIVNIPVKSQQHTQSNSNQVHQQMVGAKTTTSNQMIQKVSVPRNVQFVTRTSNISNSNVNSNNIIMSRGGGNSGSVQSTVIQSKGGATHQQILMPQSSNIKTTMTQHNNVKNSNKTQVQSVKIFQGAQNKSSGGIASSSNQGGMKSVISNQSQKLTNVKTSPNAMGQSKHIKQFYNVANSTQTSISSHQYIQHPIQQQQQKNLSQQQHQTNLIYSPNHNNNNNNNANTNNNNNTITTGKVQTVHYPRTANSINNVLIQGGKMITKGTKYVVQNPTPIVMPSSNSNNIMTGTSGGTGSNMQQLKISATQSFTNSAVGGSTIKYVNAQGNVIQPPTKVRAIFQQSSTSPGQQQLQHQHHHQQSLIYSDNSTHQNDMASSQPHNSSIDDMNVNGTIMTDEMSARILQSLSQQKIVCSSNRQYSVQQPQQQHLQQSHNMIQKIYQTAAGTSSAPHKMFLASNDSGHFGNAATSHVRDDRSERYFKVR